MTRDFRNEMNNYLYLRIYNLDNITTKIWIFNFVHETFKLTYCFHVKI
jgi:hypothetical protein